MVKWILLQVMLKSLYEHYFLHKDLLLLCYDDTQRQREKISPHPKCTKYHNFTIYIVQYC